MASVNSIETTVLHSNAVEEKSHMIHLNDRLADYIQRMRKLAGSVDSPGYRDAMRILENEIIKLKGMYENELDKLRAQLDNNNRDKNALMSARNLTVELENRLADENGKVRNALDQLAALQRALSEKDKEIAGLRGQINGHGSELNIIRPAYDKLQGDYGDLQRRYEEELRMRQDLDTRLKGLADKLKFDNGVLEQQKKDAEDRLRSAQGIIASLEAKIKQLSGGDLQEQLRRLREQHAAELKKYQQEAEANLNRSLAALKQQTDEEMRMRDSLSRDKARLEEMLRELSGKVKFLEGQLQGSLAKQKSLEDTLNEERARAARQIQELERRLRELQDNIMNKIRECNAARDVQVSLKAEIDSYRALLEEEERRVQSLGAARGGAGGAGGLGGGLGGAGGGGAGSSSYSYSSSSRTTGGGGYGAGGRGDGLPTIRK